MLCEARLSMESKEIILSALPYIDEMFYLFVCEAHPQASLLPQPQPDHLANGADQTESESTVHKETLYLAD